MASAQFNLDNTVGSLFLGIVFTAVLFGINVLQSYFYYHEFPNDSWLHRISVLILCLLDALHFALVVHNAYTYIVTGFGNIPGLEIITWSFKLQVLVNVVVIFIVHSLYTARIWLLGGYHRGAWSYIVISIVVTGFAFGIFLAYSVYTVHTYSELLTISWSINVAISLSTVIEFAIAATMCYYLWKSKGQIRELNSRISTIIQYTWPSGLLTGTCSLSVLLLFHFEQKTFIYLAVQLFSTKLYVGSFLAMLNARERDGNGSGSFSGTASVDVWQQPKTVPTTSNHRPLSTMTNEIPMFSTSNCQNPDGQC